MNRLLALPFIAFLLAAFYAPFAILIYYSLAGREGVTIAAYLEIVTNPVYVSTVIYSAVVAAVVTVAVALVTLPAAIYVAIYSRGLEKAVLLVALVAPFWVDFLIRAWAMKGALYAIGIREGFLAMILGFIYEMIPYMFLPTYVSLSRMPKSILDAAKVLGASEVRALASVAVPYAAPGLAVGAIIVALLSFAEFVIPSLLGGTSGYMVGAMVYELILKSDRWGVGAALAVIITLATAAAIFAARGRLGDGR